MQQNPILYGLYHRLPGGVVGAPFYFGIGTERRARSHITHARNGSHVNKGVQRCIRAHLKRGVEPVVKTLCVCHDRDYAGALERGMIAAYGRRRDGGPLFNITAGGEYGDPEFAREVARRPGVSEKRSVASKEMNARTWADPEIRARRVTAMRGKKKTASPESLAARRENLKAARTGEAVAAHATASKEVWNRPGHRERMTIARSAAWRDEKKRASMLAGRSAGISASWQDPAVREKRIEGIKAASTRKSLKGNT